MGKPAARIGDHHVCPVHAGGPVLPPGKPTVWIGGRPAATLGSVCTCAGPPDAIIEGSNTVFINGFPAARMGDMTSHGGRVATGEPTVLIGDDRATTIATRRPWPEAASAPTASPSGNAPNQSGVGPEPPIPPECSYLGRRDRVTVPPADFQRMHREVRISDPPRRIQHRFTGGPSAEEADEYTVSVRTGADEWKRVRLIMPVNAPGEANTYLPTADQMALSLGVVPPPLLGTFPHVEASPYRSPSDARFAREQGVAGFRAAATASRAEGVIFHPTVFRLDQSQIDSNMIHETAHPFDETLSVYNESARNSRAWQQAIQADGRVPSDYAARSLREDFAESTVMYSVSRGTSCEAAARQRFPNRYRLLDEWLGSRMIAPGQPLAHQPANPPQRDFWQRLGDWFSGRS